MKKHLLIVLAIIALVGFKPNVSAQSGFNTVLEYCTGTWCQWCPCGHDIINGFLASYPNTMVLAYHGASSDPWKEYSLPMIQAFGFSSYPTGVVGRRTGVISRSGWNNQVVVQTNSVTPGVTIAVNNKTYNSGTRTITADVVITSTSELTGTYNVVFICTEDNLIYSQTGNGSCTGGGNYVHKHVVKGLVNGSAGTLVNSADPWANNVSYTIPLSYVIPNHVAEANANMNMFVYKTGGSISTDQTIQQSRIISVVQPVGISNETEVAESYSLSQNYPNPFNPTTNFRFSIPKEQNVSLKFYNSMGQEVATYVDGFLKAGVYNVDFDGSSLSTGIYFYTLRTSDFVETKKMMLVK
ncbi:MAG: Omp28-related outer membrane protein [Ignavibacteria bacterium]|nr:Omp28-related outer membrane protein [Ignavibacteria bacterium]